MIDLLDCTVMPYAWGSRTAIAELTGRPSPSSGPEAELWMGAHPMAPSRLTRDGVTGRGLAEVIEESPTRELGTAVSTSFGPRLPFLLKVLAAAQPLSLQAHPNEAQARAGFADEDQRGIPRDAPTRNYRDASHKPELLCALVPVDALCGFRSASETLALFDELGVKELENVIAPLHASPNAKGIAETFRRVMEMGADEGKRVVAATVAACEKARARIGSGTGTGTFTGESRFAAEYAWAGKLDALYPGDVGIVSALMLNLVRLDVGEAIYLGAGNLHAYLDGVGVEIMASSDNVLRGGLTKKHVDVAELIATLDFSNGPVHPIRARAIDAHERVWETPAREFRLSAIDVEVGESVTRDVAGPEIVLCTSGSPAIVPADGSPQVVLRGGASAFVAAATGRYTVRNTARSRASLYRATVNLT